VILGVCGEVPTSCCASRSEFAQQASGKTPDPSIAWCWVCTVSKPLATMHAFHFANGDAWIEEAKMYSDGGHHLSWIGSQDGNLWSHRNHHVNEEAARRAVRRVKVAYKMDAVGGIADVNAELFVQLSNCRLFWCLTWLHLPARERELPTVHAPLCPLNQQYLTVEWMRIGSARRGGRTTTPCVRRRNDKCGNRSFANALLWSRMHLDRL
jgi:hypothetical protein